LSTRCGSIGKINSKSKGRGKGKSKSNNKGRGKDKRAGAPSLHGLCALRGWDRGL
jgi:hypothetical protein